jgi:hypothetical protein
VCRRPLVAILVVVTLVLSAAPARATALPQAHAPKAGLFCPCWGGAPKSAAAWAEAAKNHSLIVAERTVLANNKAVAKQANANIVLLPYDLGPFLSKGSAAYNSTLADHAERFARDKNNNLINPPTFPNNYLMDLGEIGWQQQMATAVASAAQGFDGVYIDSMGIGPLTGYTTAAPINRATNQTYTATEWEAAARDAINSIKAKLPDKYVMFNGLSNGGYYNAGTKLLADSTADGAMSEAWVRMAKSDLNVYPTVDQVKLEIAEMRDVRKKGKDFFAWTKTWADGTDAQKAAWNTFAFGVFLLGTQGRAFYAFVSTNGGDRSGVPPVNKTDIGAPKGEYTLINGVFKREFQKATVVVNPAAKTASITPH